MKIGIIYDTDRREATIKVVDWIKTTLEQEGFEVKAGKPHEFSNFDYDGFIVGSAVYGFKVRQEKLLNFLRDNQDQFQDGFLGVFVVCRLTILSGRYLKGMIKKLPRNPITQIAFRGYFDPKPQDKQRFIEKEKPKAIEWANEIVEMLSSL